MSVRVQKAFINGALSWYFSKAGCIRIMDDVSLCLEVERNKRCYAFEILFKKGYENYGFDVPGFFRGLVPKNANKNVLYNFAVFALCALYEIKGCLQKDFILTRSECNAVFRGVLVKSGISCFRAFVISFVLNCFGRLFNRWVVPFSGKNFVFSKIICIDGC